MAVVPSGPKGDSGSDGRPRSRTLGINTERPPLTATLAGKMAGEARRASGWRPRFQEGGAMGFRNG
jgi:hypothetical protein